MLISRRIVNNTSDAYKVVANSEPLFGDINTVKNKDGLRHILTENMMRIYNKAMEAASLKEANEPMESLQK